MKKLQILSIVGAIALIDGGLLNAEEKDYIADIQSKIAKKSNNISVNQNTADDSSGIIITGSEDDGKSNVYYGKSAGSGLSTGEWNSMFGAHAGWSVSEGWANTCIGIWVECGKKSYDNTVIGSFAGNGDMGSGNVFIGSGAGYDYEETGSNKLYIANGYHEDGRALIYGEFDNDLVRINGSLEAKFKGSGIESVYRLLTLSANDTDGTGPSEAGFVLNNALYQKEWLFRTIDDGKAFTATLGGTGGAEFKVSSPTGHVSGTELYLGNGAKNVGGVWYNASSRALKENIKPLSTKEALTAFSKLQPVTYNYKTDKSEKVVGFIAEDVPELVSINSRDSLSSMDMVAVLTKVVQEQDKMLKVQAEKIAKLETMQKRLVKVESLLTNLALDTSKTTKEKISLK